MSSDKSSGTPARYEILPFTRAIDQAGEVGIPLQLTVTCSPKHGPDHSLDVAARACEIGHEVTLHVAARMVRDAAHATSLLTRAADLGIQDIFLIGGDAAEPAGEYASAGDLLGVIAEHPLRPARLGIGGYPEGHPLIDGVQLDEALLSKATLADYVTTQLCFDSAVLRGWLERQRAAGLRLPVWIGMPGHVSATKLLEISTRIGVGPSISFLRKQGSLRNLRGLLTARRGTAAEQLLRAVSEIAVNDRRLAGVHYFTFNELIETHKWHQTQRPRIAPFIEVPASTVTTRDPGLPERRS